MSISCEQLRFQDQGSYEYNSDSKIKGLQRSYWDLDTVWGLGAAPGRYGLHAFSLLAVYALKGLAAHWVSGGVSGCPPTLVPFVGWSTE